MHLLVGKDADELNKHKTEVKQKDFFNISNIIEDLTA